MLALLVSCALGVQEIQAVESFELENRLTVHLRAQADAPAAVVMLGIRAGVHDEPEGRSGLAHLAEHMFLHGGTKSAEAGTGFEKLAKEGPLAQSFADVNAETMWDLTYFYALRKPGDVELPLDLFAEKLAGVTYEKELLEAKTGLSDAAVLDRVGMRVTTLGADGVRVTGRDIDPIEVGVASGVRTVDPTGVGDGFRAGFFAARSWGLPIERACQLGSLIAALVLETEGGQEYEVRSDIVLKRLAESYGDECAADVRIYLPTT